MWILTKKLHTSAYAQDTKESGLDLEAFCQTCEKSLTWRGKDSLSRTWLQRWKRESWMQHLSSRTLRPSHTESFVDAWTSSLEDSRVSHSQLLESVKLLKTPDTSSPTSQTESESANLELFSSKTFKESSVARQPTESQFSSMSSESWKDWVTEQRQEYSQRKKSAHLIRESESLSLGWPTARTSDAEGGRIETEMTGQGFKSKRHKSNQTFGAKLRDAVETHEEQKNWPTMTVKSGGGLPPNSKSKSKSRKQHAGHPLETAVMKENWPTTTTAEGTKIGNQPNFGQVGLSNHPSIVGQPDRAKLNTSGKSQESWLTPRVLEVDEDYENYQKRMQESSNPKNVGKKKPANLTMQAKSQESWGTPRASTAMTAKITENLVNRNVGNLEEQHGKQSIGGKLNPNWVEHLMGLPVGWTDLGSWETE